MRASSPWWILLIGVAAAGCHKDPPPPALGGWGDDAANVVCNKVYECCMPMELVEHMQYGGGRDECGRKSQASFGFWAAVIEQEQTRGRLAFDATTSRRCLASFAAATCDMHKRNPKLDGCDTFITARTAPGGACQANESCIGGACIGVKDGNDGVCKAFVGEGISCDGAPCEKGLHCEAGTKICQRDRPDGASCNLHGECASQGCNGRNADAGTPGTCGLKGGENTTCFVTVGCSLGGPRAAAGPGALVVLGVLLLARRRRRAT